MKTYCDSSSPDETAFVRFALKRDQLRLSDERPNPFVHSPIVVPLAYSRIAGRTLRASDWCQRYNSAEA